MSNGVRFLMRRRVRRRLRLLILAGAGLLSLCVVMAYLVPSALYDVLHWPVSPALYDAEGRLFHARLSESQEYCIPVALDSMGRWLPMLAVEVEDRRFYSHHGLDPLALVRAAHQNLSRGRRVSGASTITSQLVRIAVPRERTPGSKALEFVQAIGLEFHLDKNEILELYLNRAPMGGTFRGVEAASLGYFRKRAENLTLAEAAMLVSMFKGPTVYRPDRNPEKLLERRDAILADLAGRGKITPEQCRMALLEPIPHEQASLPARSWHFASLSLAETRDGYWKEGGAPLRTTLRPGIQRLLGLGLAEQLSAFHPKVTASGIIVDNATGAVLAYVGNARFDPVSDRHWVDCGTSPRSPGSVLKPFVYLEAMEQGLIVPGTLLADTPLALGGQAPQNFDKMYRGPVSAAAALSDSLNAPAVRVLRLAGGESVIGRLRGLGFRHLVRPASWYGDSLALGGCEVTLLELAGAYTALAGLGHARPLTTRNFARLPGEPLTTPNPLAGNQGVHAEGHKSELAATRVFSPQAAYLVTEMLTDIHRLPFARREPLVRKKRNIAFKTGTSYGLRDAWACAYTPEHTVVVWFGNEDGTPDEGLVGIASAAPVAARILADIPATAPGVWFPPPDGIENFTACALSGRPASPFCPQKIIATRIHKVSKTFPCEMHRETREGLVTVLPPDLEEYARLRSLAAEEKARIDITSPRNGSRFYLNTAAPQQKIHLSCEGASGRVHWFVNRQFFAAQDADKVLLWPMRPGKFSVSLVDERGKTAFNTFEIVDMAEETQVPLLFR